ncbi:MAG: aldo/keto reductase [Pseudomonadota bacterium]
MTGKVNSQMRIQGVPRIGQGTMGLGGNFSPDYSRDEQCVRALRLGIDLGLTLIDVAENYGGGHAEELVGRAVRGVRDQVLICTKVSPEHLAFDRTIEACENSLKRLGIDTIDLYQIHWPNAAIPIEDTMAAMIRLRDQGKIRHIGVSNFSLPQMVAAGPEVVSNQLEYNLFDRMIEQDVAPYCRENNLLLLAYSPLDQGRIEPDSDRARLLTGLAEKYGKTPSQIALNWLTAEPNVTAIPKAMNAEHIRRNAEAIDFDMDTKDALSVDRAFQTDPLEIPPDQIKVVLDGQGSRQAYQTIEQALENKLGFTPSPAELAREMLELDQRIKPVRVRSAANTGGPHPYELVEGRIRYWAWVIAHEGRKKIPVLLRD